MTTLTPQQRKRSDVPLSADEVIDIDSICFTPGGGGISNSTITTSTSTSTSTGNRCHPVIIDLSDGEDDDDVRILNFIPLNTPFGKRRKTDHHINNNNRFFERGECSKDAPFVCGNCRNTKTVRDSFSIRGCSHAYCSECVAMYVGSKLQENVINIRCPVPGCSGLLEAEYCRAILPAEVLDWWKKASREIIIVA
ncbi:uncharacterized protein LOC130725085 [Lotus japonicus]|uniref:uncharacterized protein LOC130725085 n=1 Tax=Lotus japonicus TaxID=34305 RepID=UPI002586C11E|nr:uncharacterized protein LOC130725085 [Lotus japonicus]